MHAGNIPAVHPDRRTDIPAVPRVLRAAVPSDSVGSETDRRQNIDHLVPSKTFRR